MEVDDIDFRLSTAGSASTRRERRGPPDCSDDDDEDDDTVQHCTSAVSFKKNILHRYCECRVNTSKNINLQINTSY